MQGEDKQAFSMNDCCQETLYYLYEGAIKK